MKLKVLSKIISVLVLAGCGTSATRIENPERLESNGQYQNLFPSHYIGNGPHHINDDLDLLKPEEKKVIERAFLDPLPSHKYSKSHGYEFSNLVYSDINIDANKQGELTWLGHASFLIQQMNNDALVTDPVFHEFDDFLGWLGQQLSSSFVRLGEAPVKADKLPFVSGVLISHDHFDHLSSTTLNTFSENTHLYLPLDNSDDADYSSGPITEMDWYTQTQHNKTKIHFLPSNHNSSRGMFDADKSLWGSWMLNDGEYKVYFAGDTGYSDVFKDIREKVGAMDVCLMPIVAYHEGKRRVHMSPEDAIQAAEDLGCKIFVPWGYGTWTLGCEHVHEPLRRLDLAIKQSKPNFSVKTLKMGESLNYHKLLSSIEGKAAKNVGI
ncbi:MBL fold metallo-hydrolase [Pseudoalteromonas sp. C2R02]|uniref:MBL fold metallo-hydrolase n=1 Tax=Pseudoalteromonas sp. C2R02 TaxID=2841565 RepID=UPI001C092482|nr:MBL fold metallo-hydrolase [Pseudoalteromonas sp. C2R02]MBU2971645.1 MBL fold metallo-hydrolase [Pseudoalteromonas sp. C2R02]